MIDVLYAVIEPFIDEKIIQSKLELLPPLLQKAILAYQKPTDKLLRLYGKLLLKETIYRFGLQDTINMDMLNMDEDGKPNFNNHLFFNQAYSIDISILAACRHSSIGIDVEKLHEIDIQLYEAYFTKIEWDTISASDSIINTFFDFWTRKEAVLKAAGKGLVIDMQNVEVVSNRVLLDGNIFFIQKVDLPSEYICHIASLVPDNPVHIANFNPF